MTGDPDVLVIGAGSIGVCSSYFLAEQGAKVTLIDRGDVCSGCSYGNAGMIVPSHSIPLAAPGVIWQGLKWCLNPESPFYIKPRFDLEFFSWLWRFRGSCTQAHVNRATPVIRDLSLKSLDLFNKLNSIDGLDFSFQEKGMLHIFKSQEGLRTGIREAEHLKKVGLDSEILDRHAVTEKMNGFKTSAIGGVFYPMDAHLIPADFVRSLAKKAESMGVLIRTSTEVLGFEVEGKRIKGVKTTSGLLTADEIVLSAGSWTPGVAKDLGLNLPIQAAKGYSVTYNKPERSPPIPLMLAEARVAVTPMDSMLRLGGTLELVGMDRRINERRVNAVIRAGEQYMPDLGLSKLNPVEVWSGLRPTTPDGLALLGRSKAYSNLTIAAGHGMIGISTGPVSGMLVSQVVRGEEPFMDIHMLDPGRFE